MYVVITNDLFIYLRFINVSYFILHITSISVIDKKFTFNVFNISLIYYLQIIYSASLVSASYLIMFFLFPIFSLNYHFTYKIPSTWLSIEFLARNESSDLS